MVTAAILTLQDYRPSTSEMDRILLSVSRVAHVPRIHILGHERYYEYLVPRMVFYWLSVEAGCSLSEIGRYSGKDHSTVLKGVRRVDAEYARFRLLIGAVKEAMSLPLLGIAA